ncbi:MAG: hypothetical protein IPK95_05210 [Cellvibrionales bacterium]|nr:hypothetical protein [Cellvibrionales bacterium]
MTLCEKSQQLGGLLSLAATMYRDNYRFLDFLRAEMQRLPITVKLGVDATPEFVRIQNADAVIIATGSTAITPEINTASNANVVTGAALHTLIANRFANNTLGNALLSSVPASSLSNWQNTSPDQARW